ncbi:zinc metalloproteinase nas-1-like [Lucilia sericata]|uniref:zinc metalloproteinase nas-1-like n=1 Tax=Lucilia sericata TaxID=13632 RepID=UPI0018A84C1A|nr:zinc metalloproteinase nas-1-like [Lucilia sericata]
MDYKLILLVTVLSVLCNNVLGIPLTSGIFKGILKDSSDDDSEIVEVVSNELPEIQDPNSIDLSVYGGSLYGLPDFNNTGKLLAQFKPHEATVNPEELGSYLEGDILMPQNAITLKNGITSKTSRWPNAEVPFEIAGDFTKEELDLIAFAIDEYHAKTCIRFIPRTSEYDYISIVRGNSGCWSSIGRVGGRQEVNLQTPGCLTKPGTAIHELMHALGFLHEQNRKERDSFVTIQFKNVQRMAVSNFQRMPNTVAFGVGYDYGSVMHYSPNAFSSNGQPTIVAKKPEGRNVMGQRDGFSPLDIEKVNRMYKCKSNPKPEEPPIELPERVQSRFPFVQSFTNNRLGAFIGNIFTGFNRLG